MELVVDTEEAAEPAGPDPVDRETVEETGLVLVVDSADLTQFLMLTMLALMQV